MQKILLGILLLTSTIAQFATAAENNCQAAYDAAIAQCTAAQTQSNDAALAALNAAVVAANQAYDGALAQHAAAELASKQAAAATHQNQLQQNNLDFAANNQNATANHQILLADCQQQHANDPVALLLCICQAEATTANILSAFANEKQVSDARAGFAKARSERLAERTRLKADWESYADCQLAKKTAGANGSKAVAAAASAYARCSILAGCDFSICNIDPNSCSAHCYTDYYNSYKAAYAAFYDACGPADADLAFGLGMAEANQAFADAMAFAAGQFAENSAICNYLWGFDQASCDLLSAQYAADRLLALTIANLHCQFGPPAWLQALPPDDPDVLAFNATVGAADVLHGQQLAAAEAADNAVVAALVAARDQAVQAASAQTTAAYALNAQNRTAAEAVANGAWQQIVNPAQASYTLSCQGISDTFISCMACAPCSGS